MFSLKRPLFYLFYLLLISNCFTLIICAKSSGGKLANQPVIPADQTHFKEEIYKLSFSSPLQYHYSPWVTRKLLLTMNSSSTQIHFFTKEQLKSVNPESLPLDYICENSFIKPIHSLDTIYPYNISDFIKTNNLTCKERAFLEERRLLTLKKKEKIDEELYKKLSKHNWQQCQTLNEQTIEKVCSEADEIAYKVKKEHISEKDGHDSLKNIFKSYKLKYCSNFELKDVISVVNRKRILKLRKVNPECKNILKELIRLDSLTNYFYCEFHQILSRIYCQGYSVRETCDECRIAYRQWLCSMVLPNHFEDVLVKPCLSICQRVERTCPYLHPEMKDQYGGEPIFICNDPDIPYMENSTDVPIGKDRACYQKCHLDANHTLTLRNSGLSNFNTTELNDENNEEALQENPELEVCISEQSILKKVQESKSIDFEDNDLLSNELEKTTENSKINQKKRDLYSKYVLSNNNLNTIEKFEEDFIIKDSFNSDSLIDNNKHIIIDDIYYLDNNTFLEQNDTEQKNDTQKIKSIYSFDEKKYLNEIKKEKQQENFHFLNDDENDNEDGDSDLDQIISTTTVNTLNLVSNLKKQPQKQ